MKKYQIMKVSRMSEIKRQNGGFIKLSILLIVLFAIVYVSLESAPNLFKEEYGISADISETLADSDESDKKTATKKEETKKVTHVDTPEAVKAIYMTACFAGTPSLRQTLVDLANETEINSIVIDIKDFSGTISFNTGNPKLKVGENGKGCGVSDMREFVEYLHEQGIYVIGRITVFQDPLYTKHRPDLAVKKESDKSVWKDYKGISFIEVGAREYWDYIVELAKESYALGFDEINFDYIRFPSDGNMKDIYFPFSNNLIEENPDLGKSIALKEFFEYLDAEMEKVGVVTSADFFGMTTTNKDDLNIGQVLENALPHFDYISPMVYPSHYPPNFNGYPDPNDYPYEVVNYSMQVAVDRVNDFVTSTSTPAEAKEGVNILQLRPWLQDFDYGGNYDVAEVKAQIQATYDAGLTSWMIWAPSNRYTRGAYLAE